MLKKHSARKGLVSEWPLSVIACVVSYFLLIAHPASATSTTIGVDLSFVDPVTLIEDNALQFGLVSTDAVLSNELSINSAGDTSGESSLFIGGSQAAAALTVNASPSSSLEIVITNIINGTGYSLGSFVCNYNGVGESDCSTALSVTSASSAVLTIGATLTADGNDTAGAANGSFDVVITYQ